MSLKLEHLLNPLTACFFTCALMIIAAPRTSRAQGAGYWHTSANKILDSNGQTVRIAGINWYGFETTDEVAHGLWARDYKSILNAIKSNGYDVVRMPLSNQMVESPIIPSNISYYNSGPINTDLSNLNSLQILDRIVAYAGQIGLRIILDNHRSEAGNSAEGNGLWYTSAYPESAWIADWKTLAQRYIGNPTVIGFDLRNEPHNASGAGSCWDCGTVANDWHLAAARAGNAVLALNPKLLIFVEGTDCYNGDCDWWGGNLEGVSNSPVVLSTANQLVYSAHDYGPNLYVQNWFNGGTTDASLISVWTRFWAYISLNGIAPVWLGEFGTTNNAGDIESSAAGSQGQWFQDLVGFLKSNPQIDWTYWAVNGEDTYALLDSNYDPTPVSALKQQLLAGIQFPLGVGPTPTPTTASTRTATPKPTNSAKPTPTPTVKRTAVPTPSSTHTAVRTPAPTPIRTPLRTPTPTHTPARTATPSPAPTAVTGLHCRVVYKLDSDWGNGFEAEVAVTNTGAAPINGWKISWTWPGNQQMTQSWNATYVQSGNSVILTNMSYNPTIAAGATQSGAGFLGTYTGGNPAPTVFYVNATRCQ
ncbi:MAG: cellulase family glycosylhydrolase [Candidatus Binataceae bacterium]